MGLVEMVTFLFLFYLFVCLCIIPFSVLLLSKITRSRRAIKLDLSCDHTQWYHCKRACLFHCI